MADFHLWSHETLVRFAQDALRKLLKQSDEIEKLKADLAEKSTEKPSEDA